MDNTYSYSKYTSAQHFPL